MRVIAGTFRGRRLDAPAGRGTRPTSDRVREALFSTLGDHVGGATVLDLYAGSGALAIEALSRGAGFAALVERDRAAAAVARRNLAALGIESPAARVFQMAAESFCARPPAQTTFDVVLCDPPYDVPVEHLADLVGVLGRGGHLASSAVVVIERDRRDPALRAEPLRAGRLVESARRTYGDTVLLYLRDQEPQL